MGTDSIFLFLMPPIIIPIIVGFMIGWLIGFGVCFFSTGIALFIAGVIYKSPVLLYSAIPLFILFILCAFESARRIIDRDNFKKRITQYITDGKVLNANRASYKTIDEYERVADEWVNKVVSDIRKHRSQSESNNFLIEYHTNKSDSMEGWLPKDIENTKRERTQSMLRSRVDWLEWLRMRL